MVDIKWADPPKQRTGPRVHDEFRQSLRANPGKWAILREGAPNTSALGPLRRSPAWRGFEFVARRGEPSGFTYYARYVGDEAQP